MSEKDIIAYYPLETRILAVAVRGAIGDWCAYIAVVPGKNHEEELYEAALHGNKLPERIARAIFPHIEGPWRD